MATVTHRVTTPDTGNTPNTSGAVVPAVGDLLVVFVTKEGSALASPMASADLTSSVAPTGFTLIRNEGHQSGTAHVGVFVADAKTVNTTSRTVTLANGADAGAGTNITVYSVSGMSRTGAAAVRQSAGQSNQSAGTPAPAFGVAALTGNAVLGCIYNATNPAGVTPPSGWTETAAADSGYTTGQVSGIESCFRNSGFTGTTVTWGSASASAFASIILELDTSPLSVAVDTGSFTISGQLVGLKRGYPLVAGAGSNAITGTAVRTAKASKVAAASGSFAIGGQSVDLRPAHRVATDAGAYALTGTAVDLSYTAATVTVAPSIPAYYLPWFLVPEEFVEAAVVSPPALSAQGDTYALTGSAVTLARSLKFAADAGSYAITGTDVGTTYTPVPLGVNPAVPAYYWLRAVTPEDDAPVVAQAYTVPTDSGSYTVSGQAVGLKVGHQEAVGTGSYAYTGQAVGLRTGPIGVIASGSYAVAGTDVSLVRGASRLAAAADSYTVAGTAVRLAVGFRTAVTTGAYLLAGTVVRLARGLRVAAATGVYTLTGTVVVLVRGRPVAVASGGYVQTGTAVALRAAYRQAAESGSFAMTGQTVALVFSGAGSKQIDVNPGAYSVFGQSIILWRTTRFPVDGGNLSLTGSAVGLFRQLRTAVDPGSYAVGGQAAGLYWRPVMPVGAGTLAYTGQSVGLRHGYPFAAGTGAYLVGGEDVELVPTKVIGVGGGNYAFAGSAIGLEWSGLVSDPGIAGSVIHSPAGTATRVFHPPLGTAGRIWRWVYG